MDLICDSRINNNNQKPKKIFNTEKFSGNTRIHTRFFWGGGKSKIHSQKKKHLIEHTHTHTVNIEQIQISIGPAITGKTYN